jgi:uncharacterized protein YecE (DUF72 family)
MRAALAISGEACHKGPAVAMTTRWHIGAKQLRGAVAAYAKRFDLLEVRVLLADAEQEGSEGTTPTIATLRRWRKSVPPHFDFSVVAGPQLSRVKASDGLEKEFLAARAALDALQARCFVLRTSPEVTPALVWRERTARVLDRLPRDVTQIVWEPSGVWEIEDAAAQAQAWGGVVVGVDPARELVPPGPIAYLRLRALGETRAFGPIALERIVRAVGARRDVFAVIETDSALAEAKRLRALVRAIRPARQASTGRLIRPRGGMVVRDDEQE